MQTVVNLTSQMADDIEAQLKQLLVNHSTLVYHGDSSLINLSGNHGWKGLDSNGRLIQSKLLEDYKHFAAIVRSLTRAQPQKYLKAIEVADKTILSVIEQHGVTWFGTTKEALEAASKALGEQKTAITNLYSHDSTPVFVPDTNALLYYPNIEDWRFPDAPNFRIVLSPTVLSELDQLKVTHRVDTVRQKAESLISRIKGYRNRGQLTRGVPLIKGVSEIIALAVEPDFASSLPWLQSDNNDDRIIATLLEVMRLNPRSAVTLVTRDINLQNKAEFARIPFCEPPSPLSP